MTLIIIFQMILCCAVIRCNFFFYFAIKFGDNNLDNETCIKVEFKFLPLLADYISRLYPKALVLKAAV